jgi:hypothetical protein
MEFSNYNLVRKINSAFIVTLPVFKQALAQAILLKRQKLQAESLAELDKKTNEMLIKNAQNTVEVSKTTAKLAAYLCYKYDLNPTTDIYTHNYFYAKKKCPIYIIPHWSTFLKNVKKYYDELVDNKATSSTTTSTTTEKKPTTTTKPATTTPVKKEPKIGDIVTFKGTKHYIGAGSSIGAKCKAGKAKITNIKKGYKHPYHLVRVSGGGSTVYGWVNAADIT